MFHDLVCDDPETWHRSALLPSNIPLAMQPVVAAIERFDTVAGLLQAACQEVPLVDPVALKRSTLAILRLGAQRGYLEVRS